MKTKILIEVRGGIVQAVHANQNINIVIVDHDNIDQGQNPIASIQGADLINKNGYIYELFTDQNSRREMDIRNQLKRLKF